MDLNAAILFGLLEQTAENVPPTDLSNLAGQTIHVTYGQNLLAFQRDPRDSARHFTREELISPAR